MDTDVKSWGPESIPMPTRSSPSSASAVPPSVLRLVFRKQCTRTRLWTEVTTPGPLETVPQVLVADPESESPPVVKVACEVTIKKPAEEKVTTTETGPSASSPSHTTRLSSCCRLRPTTTTQDCEKWFDPFFWVTYIQTTTKTGY